MAPPPLYVVVAECDDSPVQLEEYDALLCEWLREALKENQQSEQRKSLRKIADETGIWAPDLSRARSGKRNVSKEMMVAVTTALNIKMSEAFEALSKIADHYERGYLKLKIRKPAADGDGKTRVRAKDAATLKRISTEVSKVRAKGNKKNKQPPIAPPPEDDASPSPRKS